MENESFQPDSYIDSEEKARIGADKENKIRDLSKNVRLTEDQKNVIAEVAEKHAEKAMQEYDIEKEKNPVEKLINRLNEIVQKMKEAGLDEDSEIVSKIQGRIDRYIEAFKNYREEYENRNNKRLTVEDFLKTYNDSYTRHFANFNKGIPVTHKIDKDGGWFYMAPGKQNSWFPSADSMSEETKKLYEEQGNEIVNFSFSKQGSTEFCKSMGVLKSDQEFIDIPTIYQDMSKSKVNPLDYKAELPTNIEGISLEIKHIRRSFDNKEEEGIHIIFDDEFLRKLLV